MGEQPNPWDLPSPRMWRADIEVPNPPSMWALGEISLLSPAYLLSFERWPFHTEPPDHYIQLSSLLDPSVSQSSMLMLLHSRTVTKRTEHTFKASDTLSEATTPVKLPTTHCPWLEVRHQENKGWYFTVGLPNLAARDQCLPTYPTHHLPNVNVKL